MKKLVMVAMILLCASIGWAADKIHRRSVTITTLGTNTPISSLVRMDMNTKAGIFLSLACDGNESDDFDLYIYDYDLDGSGTQGEWHAHADRDSEVVLAFSKSSSVVSWRDDTTLPSFSCEDATQKTSLYIGVYNDDDSATATIECEFRFISRKYDDMGSIN